MTLSRPMFPPVDQARRLFLSQAAGVAAGGTALALAIIPQPSAAAAPAGSLDPVYVSIDAHRESAEPLRAAEAESMRQFELGTLARDDDADFDDLATAEMDRFLALLAVVPTTLAGVVALVTYLDQILKRDPWKFEDNYATPLIGNLARAFERMAVAS